MDGMKGEAILKIESADFLILNFQGIFYYYNFRSESYTLRLYFLWSEIHLKSTLNINFITSLFDGCLKE